MERQTRAGRERAAPDGPRSAEQQAREHTRDGDARRSGSAAKLSSMPTSATVPEARGGDRRGGERGPDRRAERAPPDAAARARGRSSGVNARGAPERRGREPAARDRATAQGSTSSTARQVADEQRVGLHVPLAHAAARQHDGERRRSGGRRGPAEERDVAGARRPRRRSAPARARQRGAAGRAGRPRRVMRPTWKPEMDSRCTSPDWAKRSCSSGSMPPRRPSMSASTSGARAPYSRRLARRRARSGAGRQVAGCICHDPDVADHQHPAGRPAGPGRGTHVPSTSAS